jgi:hypothetical protein
MAKRVIEGIEVEASSGNVFADLDLPNAEELKIKSALVIEIARAVRLLGLSRPGYDIEIQVRPAAESTGRLSLALA